MRRSDRPVPFPYGTPAWRNEFARLRREWKPAFWARRVRQIVREANAEARRYPVKGEKCEARTRKGTPCQAKAMTNGRCPNHGGLSTGPTTPGGKAKAMAALGQPMRKGWKPHHAVELVEEHRRQRKQRLAWVRICSLAVEPVAVPSDETTDNRI